MPNEPRGRTTGPQPHPTGGSRGASPARVLVAAAAVAAVVAMSTFVGGLAGGAFDPASSLVAIAGRSPSPAPATPVATLAPSPSPSPTVSPSPPASPSPPPPSATPTATPAAAAVPAERLQARLDAIREKLSIPGVSVAILWDDGRSWLGVSGRSDVAGKVAVRPDSGFAWASVSKTLTAAVVLQLVEDGRLGLDDPVAPLLPAYALDGRITARMLLDHTSGLPDFFFHRRIDRALQSAPGEAWTPERAWSYVRHKRPAPGTVWTYSNTNYLLLGELVRAVTGRSLAAEVRDRLLDPLGLEHTWYQAVERPRTPLTTGYRLVAKPGGGVRAVRVAPASSVMPFRSVVTAAGGAGSLAGTAEDAARWMQALGRGRVLSPAMQQAMVGDAVTTAAMGARVPYGLGIQVVTLDGRAAIGHSGRYLGFRNVVRYLPAEGVTIAVLTNQGAADPSRIATALLKIVLPGPEPSASPAPSATAVP